MGYVKIESETSPEASKTAAYVLKYIVLFVVLFREETFFLEVGIQRTIILNDRILPWKEKILLYNWTLKNSGFDFKDVKTA